MLNKPPTGLIYFRLQLYLATVFIQNALLLLLLDFAMFFLRFFIVNIGRLINKNVFIVFQEWCIYTGTKEANFSNYIKSSFHKNKQMRIKQCSYGEKLLIYKMHWGTLSCRIWQRWQSGRFVIHAFQGVWVRIPVSLGPFLINF